MDNGYTLFLDGQEIGRGSDWRTVSKYDLTLLLKPGRHVIGVEGFNDRLEAGFMFGMQVLLSDQSVIEMVSDDTWSVAPGDLRHWADKKSNPAGWRHAVVVGSLHAHPWELWPMGMATVPPLHPPIVHFWQRGWFQLSLLTACALTALFCLWLLAQLAAQAKAQKILQVERARIARDIHDDVGAQLTQLVLLGEVAQREQPADSAAQAQFRQMCEWTRAVSHSMDEVVWTVNSRRDTVRDFVSHVCKFAQQFLRATSIRCRLDVEAEIPALAFDLPVRRNLFLAVKEALNNAAKHSAADELFLRIYRREQKLLVAVEDNGQGFDPAQADGGRNGLANMTQRMNDVGGSCEVSSQPGGGCLVVFTVPLPRAERGWLRRWSRAEDLSPPVEPSDSSPSS